MADSNGDAAGGDGGNSNGAGGNANAGAAASTNTDQGANNGGNGTGAGGNANAGADANKGGTDQNTFDINNLDQNAWDQIFKHDRFKQLNQKAKTADQLLKEKADAEEAALKEQGKWQELAEKQTQETERWKTTSINAEIKAQAAKLGAVDLDAVAVLADKSGVSIDDNGNITGAEDVVKGLVESKPYLFNNSNNNTNTQPRVGSGTNPGNANNQGNPKFTHSQIKDPKFFKEHEAEIMTAIRTGQVVDDLAH